MLTKYLSILLAILAVFLINNSALSEGNSYFLAVLVIFCIIYITIMRRKNPAKLFSGSAPEVFGLTALVLLIITSTGSLNSSVFFFLYFLLFGLAFLATPTASFVFLLGIIIFFLPEAMQADLLSSFIKLGSLLLIAPIAYFFGLEFERRGKMSDKIEAKTEEIITEAQSLREDPALQNKDEADALATIIEEAESLKKDSED